MFEHALLTLLSILSSSLITYLLVYSSIQFKKYHDYYHLRVLIITLLTSPILLVLSAMALSPFISYLRFKSINEFLKILNISYLLFFSSIILIASLYLKTGYPMIIRISSTIAIMLLAMLQTISLVDIFLFHNYFYNARVRNNTIILYVNPYSAVLIFFFILSMSISVFYYVHIVRSVNKKKTSILQRSFFLFIIFTVSLDSLIISIHQITILGLMLIHSFYVVLLFIIVRTSLINPIHMIPLGISPFFALKNNYITYGLMSLNDELASPCYYPDVDAVVEQSNPYLIQDESIFIRLNHILLFTVELSQLHDRFTFLLTPIQENPNVFALLISPIIPPQENSINPNSPHDSSLNNRIGLVIFIPITIISFISSISKINQLFEKYSALFFQNDDFSDNTGCLKKRDIWDKVVIDILQKIF